MWVLCIVLRALHCWGSSTTTGSRPERKIPPTSLPLLMYRSIFIFFCLGVVATHANRRDVLTAPNRDKIFCTSPEWWSECRFRTLKCTNCPSSHQFPIDELRCTLQADGEWLCYDVPDTIKRLEAGGKSEFSAKYIEIEATDLWVESVQRNETRRMAKCERECNAFFCKHPWLEWIYCREPLKEEL